jgi:hypothetical protein
MIAARLQGEGIMRQFKVVPRSERSGAATGFGIRRSVVTPYLHASAGAFDAEFGGFGGSTSTG